MSRRFNKVKVRSIFETVLLCAVLCLFTPASSLPAQLIPPAATRPVSLKGFWLFEMDPADVGERQLWFNRNLRYRLQLPGILQSQNYGDEINTDTPWVLTLYDRFWYLRDDYQAYTNPKQIRIPFLSQPPRHYLGPAWYQRPITIPPEWVGRRIVLTLERPHWQSTVWVDGQKIGSDMSLVAPHIYDLGNVPPGQHRLTIRVDNRLLMSYRPDAHSVSDSLGGSWNGIVGRIELAETGRVWIDDARVFPNLKQRSMLIKVGIGNVTGRGGSGTLTAIWPDIGIVPVTWDENGGTAEIEVPLRDDVQTWDEFHPKLYLLTLWLKATGVDEYKELTIGLRELRAEGNEFMLNGRPINFRGTHSGGDFPLTGYPPTDITSWRKIFETCRSWGLNHIRFHSWCPPEAAFQAADQLGLYLQPEPGMWNEISPQTPIERMLYTETDRMIAAYGNHPSFMLLSASNEPKRRWHESLTKWVQYYRKEDPSRLYATGTGHTEREVPNITVGTDFLPIQRIGPLPLRRESGWFGADYRASLVDINIPVISHEVGQWAAYPDYDLIKKFTGYMRPGNLEIFRDSMKAHGLLEKNKEFARASGRFQLACYKEEIEANLRTPGLGGFQLLDLHDYLGQGTAFVGLLDPFWEEKGYATPDEFKEFCNATVPLARLKRVFTKDESFEAEVEIAHFGPEPMENTTAVWGIKGFEDFPLLKGKWNSGTIPIGKNAPLGKISLDLSKLRAPAEYTLIVTVAPASFFGPDDKIKPGPDVVKGTTYFENHWNFWLYPGNAAMSAAAYAPEMQDCPHSRSTDILITNSWDNAEGRLAAGGKVLFVPRNSDLNWSSPPLDTVPVFWNRLMGPAWGRMLGLFIDRKPGESKSHALDEFPSSSHFDWQWAQIVANVRAINLDHLPAELEPVVWAIDDWNRNYKLGVIFECTVGDGKLLVSAIDVTRPDGNPVSRQLRRSLVDYMMSDCFQPNVFVSREQIRGLLFDTRIMKKLGAVAQVNGAPASSAIDGDPNTFVVVGDQRATLREQVDLEIKFTAPVAMSGLVIMPRQNHREHEGDVRQYAVQVSDDGNEWRDVTRGELVSTFAPQHIEFGKSITAKLLKFISLSGFGQDKTTSLAELAIIYAGPKLNDRGGSAINN